MRELKGLRKLRLAPGASVEITLTLTSAGLTCLGSELQPHLAVQIEYPHRHRRAL